jgi:hypothetical protein
MGADQAFPFAAPCPRSAKTNARSLRMKFLDRDHPMFRRAWVRWLTVLFPAMWAAVEFYFESPFWAILFAALSAYAFWVLILRR